MNSDPPLILLTGGTGYIGGRLLPLLEQRTLRLRCLCRQPDRLKWRTKPTTEVVAGDVLVPDSLSAAMQGVHTTYYLVHSLGTGKDFEREDRQAATNFGTVARQAGVQRIIYLGGLGDPQQKLSAHLRSRQETGEVLRASGVPVIELRASIIIGSGSLSFELIRALTERLPVMVCPRWVATSTQPIAIEDVMEYLLAALDLPVSGSHTFEIGGPDVVSYGGIMREYARQRGHRPTNSDLRPGRAWGTCVLVHTLPGAPAGFRGDASRYRSCGGMRHPLGDGSLTHVPGQIAPRMRVVAP